MYIKWFFLYFCWLHIRSDIRSSTKARIFNAHNYRGWRNRVALEIDPVFLVLKMTMLQNTNKFHLFQRVLRKTIGACYGPTRINKPCSIVVILCYHNFRSKLFEWTTESQITKEFHYTNENRFVNLTDSKSNEWLEIPMWNVRTDFMERYG